MASRLMVIQSALRTKLSRHLNTHACAAGGPPSCLRLSASFPSLSQPKRCVPSRLAPSMQCDKVASGVAYLPSHPLPKSRTALGAPGKSFLCVRVCLLWAPSCGLNSLLREKEGAEVAKSMDCLPARALMFRGSAHAVELGQPLAWVGGGKDGDP